MKKFMKVTGITSLILILVGIFIGTIATLIQGPVSMTQIISDVTNGTVNAYWNNKNDWGFTIGDKAVQKFLSQIDDEISFTNKYNVLNGNVEKYSLGKDIRNLDFEVGGGTLILTESEDSEFYMEAVNVGKFQTYIENNTLYVKSVQTTNQWKPSYKGEIILYVPANYNFDEIEAEVGAGVFELGTLNAKQASLEVGAGQISVQGIYAEELNLTVAAGEVLVSDMEVSNLEAEVGMGHIYMNGSVTKRADIECGMGSIEFVLAGEEQDFNYYLESAMGQVIIGGNNYSGLAYEKNIENQASKEIAAECGMGSIAIMFEK